MLKRILRSRALQACLGFLVAAYMVLIKYTTRWDIERSDVAAPVIGTGEGVIALTWHSRFMMLNAAWKKAWQHPHVLISLSRDGALVAYTTRFLGLSNIRGSSKKVGSKKAKGGSQAVKDMLAALEAGGCVVITPDGPRGPRQRLGSGAVTLAKLSGRPILPCIFAVKNRKQFDSWDRFVLPLPFGRGKIIWGTPVSVSAGASDRDIETIRAGIESEMNTLLARADQALGHDPVEPAPAGKGAAA